MSPSGIDVSFASFPYDRMVALQSGEVKVEGVNLNFLVLESVREIFDRMVGNKEFDVSELSLSEYICRYQAGYRDFVALPVFPSRTFRHGFIAVNTRTVKGVQDLNGKRIGVQLYTMTAAVWIRSILELGGVDLSTIQWIQGSMELSGRSHGDPKTTPLVEPVNIIPNTTDKSLSQLLEDGDIDATIGAELPTCLGKPHVRRLFPDFKAMEMDYYGNTGIFPIMHTIIMKRELYERHPWIATSLFKSLNESKEIARSRLKYIGGLRYMLPWIASELDEIQDVFGGDPWVNGVEANRNTLEALVKALRGQGMIKEMVDIEELFVPVVGQN